ncbi:M15 family metallopeptidase [Acinetobacter pittii]|uniref:M15 family metallopeptidase n=1 Tax=Acinetobacter pittii TaxID=48296 RepID=UPI000E5B31E5|nr:M15 family metallopeptidase [Acinetobacter pittii]
MSFKLGKRSLSNLEGVHPDLVKVVNRAIELTQVDFTVIEGLRTKERQAQLLKEKKTTTKNSRHLTGHAVDLAAWVIPEGSDKGTVSWDWKYYEQIADAMKKAALELKIPIEWGGDWKTFKDGPHFQLPFKQYPKP